MLDPVASDPGTPVTGQFWFNTTSDRLKGYDGSNVFTLLRLDGNDTITAIFNFNPASGSVPFTVDASMNSTVTNLNADRVDGYHAAEAATVSTLAARDASGNLTVATPTSDGHAATKAYVDGVAAGQDWKDSCVAATTANITLSGEQTIDGVSVTDGERVLVKDQSTGSENGIYVCSTGSWSRSTDADENAEVTSGLTTFIEEGTENAGSGYTLTTTGTIVVGTDALTFTRSSGGSVYTAGNGMVKSGTVFHFAQSSAYSIGQIPYADSSSTIGMLAAGTANYVLKGQGAGSAPIWGQVNVSSEIIGTLPTGNGGTGTTTTFTSGSVIFAVGSGVYGQDNANLFWNNGSNLLGIRKNNPSYAVDIGYDGSLVGLRVDNDGSSGNAPASILLETAGGARGGGVYYFNSASSDNWFSGVPYNEAGVKFVIAYQADAAFQTTTARTDYAVLTALHNGNVGIGDTSPPIKLSVTNDSSNTSANGILTLNNTDTTANNWIGLNFTTTDTSADLDGVARIAVQTTSRSASGVTGDLTFWTSDDANNPSERMRILSDGNIGMGTSSPSTLLDVSGSVAGPARLYRSTAGNCSLQVENTLDAVYMGITSDGNLGLGFDLNLSNSYLQINSSGLVGIGTTNPQELLHIADANTDPFLILERVDTSVNAGGRIGGIGFRGGETTVSNVAEIEAWAESDWNADDSPTYLTISLTPDGATAAAEVFRIASNGDLTVTSTTLVDNLNADMLDSQEGSYYLDLANSTGDTDDISEGLTNLFYTDARARASLSSTDAAEIAYDSGTGVLGLGTEAGRVKSGTIGNGASTSLTFTHSLGTRDVIVQVYRTGTPYDTILCDVTRNSTSQVTCDFNTAPTTNEFTVVVTAANG